MDNGTIMNKKKSFDVFISHAIGDSVVAREIAEACRTSGLEAVSNADLPPREKRWNDTLWEALAESRAMLTILSPAGPTPSMSVEIGAAKAWSKPIFAVTAEPSSTRLPIALAGVPLYSMGRIEDVISAIKTSAQQMTDDDRLALADVYANSDVTVDQLALKPGSLDTLVKGYQAATGKTASGERLLSELLRMRKQGRLRRIRPAPRSKRGA